VFNTVQYRTGAVSSSFRSLQRIYNERLDPIWIRSLQPTPLIFPLGTGSSDRAMLRGGFSINPMVNLNYATYFSTLSTMNKFESDRLAGGRIGFFLPVLRDTLP
jgi:hypothetical protein